MKPWTKVDTKTGRFIRQFGHKIVYCPCGLEMRVSVSKLSKGRGKHCSKACMYKYREVPVAERHYKWKGTRVSYSGIHKWVAKYFGQPMLCEWCGFETENKYQIQWANISGEYKRDRSDWLRLCAKCHWHYDREGERAGAM